MSDEAQALPAAAQRIVMYLCMAYIYIYIYIYIYNTHMYVCTHISDEAHALPAAAQRRRGPLDRAPTPCYSALYYTYYGIV